MRQNIIGKILLVVAIPMVLLIGNLTFGYFSVSANSVYEQSYTAENLSYVNADGAGEYTTVTLAHPPLVQDTEVLYFNGQTATAGENYTILNQETGEINITQWNTSTGSDQLYANYTGHGGEGYQQVEEVRGTAYAGFNLAGILPLVIAGVTMLGIVIGVFAYGLRRQ